MIEIVSTALIAATAVYRLELTDETPYIVGEDGQRRQVCLVDPAEYAMMTGKMDRVWKTLNATEKGRRELHGSRAGQTVTNGVKTTVYADGYRFSEKMEKRTGAKIDTFSGADRRSERRRNYIDALNRSKGKTRTVTIEHNAATGKDRMK